MGSHHHHLHPPFDASRKARSPPVPPRTHNPALPFHSLFSAYMHVTFSSLHCSSPWFEHRFHIICTWRSWTAALAPINRDGWVQYSSQKSLSTSFSKFVLKMMSWFMTLIILCFFFHFHFLFNSEMWTCLMCCYFPGSNPLPSSVLVELILKY